MYAALLPENILYRTVAVLKQGLGPKNNLSHLSFHLAVANWLVFKLPTMTPK